MNVVFFVIFIFNARDKNLATKVGLFDPNHLLLLWQCKVSYKLHHTLHWNIYLLFFSFLDIPAIMTRSRSRPSYVVPKKDQIRQRKLSGTYSKRALSPMINDRVRQYLSKADEKLEDVLERIVQKVHDTAENAQVKVQNWYAFSGFTFTKFFN